MNVRSVLPIAALTFILAAHAAPATAIDFVQQVAPILRDHCLRCHGETEPGGELSLATSADLVELAYVVPGQPRDSSLLDAITAAPSERPAMPKESPPLSAEQIDVIRNWIEAGAPWPAGFVLQQESKADAAWWSLQPLAPVEPPPAAYPQSGHPIDRFIHARLRTNGLRPSPPADRRTLIRRLSFDLLGLPPTPAAVKAFLADDDLQAYGKLVDRLLESPHFGERRARHWLDIAHYGDTHGFERDQRRDHAWPYRDYLIRAFNRDKPYDRFLREQIAGDVIAPHDPDSVVATGFLAAGPWDYVGQVEAKNPALNRASRALDLDDMVTQVMTTTLAMTANCARCHDHKLDPITQDEYYQLVAVFAGLRRGDRDVSQSARQEYEATQRRLQSALEATASQIGRLERTAVDLADIVGGGGGFGTGRRGSGLDVRDGRPRSESLGALDRVEPGNYSPCDNPFVDGVFVPGANRTVISSSGLTVSGLPANGGMAWDLIRNGPVTSQFSTRWGGIDFAGEGNAMIGLHANAGITFDVRAIRDAVWPVRPGAAGQTTLHFSSVVGYGGRTEKPSAEFWIYRDGQRLAHQRIGRNDAVAIDVTLPPSTRFLTLISTDGGNGYGHDQISFGNPKLEPTTTSPPVAAEQVELARLREQYRRLQRQRENLGAPPVFFGVVPETPPVVHVLLRGNPETPGRPVLPGALGWKKETKTFGDSSLPEGLRRQHLVDWMLEEQRALAARVIVNRLWQWHFGRGIVSTPSDFGYGGARPTHPELLDWLAARLIANHWSLKSIDRLIVTSETYRQTSQVEQAQPSGDAQNPREVDTDNRLLWRMNVRRLEAEAVRDAVLAVAGTLNRTMYGPGYRDFDYQEAYAPIYSYKTADTPSLWRRSVYRFIVRTTPPHFMTALDCPDPANLTPRRNVTTTAIQSLTMFNNGFMLQQAEHWAARLARENSEPDAQVRRAFWLAFGRPPGADEFRLARPFVDDQGLSHLCRTLFNANEFLYID